MESQNKRLSLTKNVARLKILVPSYPYYFRIFQ